MKIEVQNLSQKFGQKIYLQNVSFEAFSGTRLGIVGKSGAGKTTLLRCLAGLTAVHTGSISYEEQNHINFTKKDWQSLRQKVGFITQGLTLLSQKTIWENLELALIPHPHIDAQKAIHNILEDVGLAHKKHAYPDELSGGQKQRVVIARALIHEPKLVLCDEFTSALDSQTTDDILLLLRRLHKPDMTFIFVTHDWHVIRAFANHVVVMDAGQIVEQGPVISVITSPNHRVTQEIIRSQEACPRGLKNLVGEGHTVLRLAFGPHNAGEPVLANILKTYPIDLNIVSGSIDALGDKPYGHLFISCPTQSVEHLISHLATYNVQSSIEAL